MQKNPMFSPGNRFVAFLKENGYFYFLCGICLFLFAYFFLSPFLRISPVTPMPEVRRAKFLVVFFCL